MMAELMLAISPEILEKWLLVEVQSGNKKLDVVSITDVVGPLHEVQIGNTVVIVRRGGDMDFVKILRESRHKDTLVKQMCPPVKKAKKNSKKTKIQEPEPIVASPEVVEDNEDIEEPYPSSGSSWTPELADSSDTDSILEINEKRNNNLNNQDNLSAKKKKIITQPSTTPIPVNNRNQRKRKMESSTSHNTDSSNKRFAGQSSNTFTDNTAMEQEIRGNTPRVRSNITENTRESSSQTNTIEQGIRGNMPRVRPNVTQKSRDSPSQTIAVEQGIRGNPPRVRSNITETSRNSSFQSTAIEQEIRGFTPTVPFYITHAMRTRMQTRNIIQSTYRAFLKSWNYNTVTARFPFFSRRKPIGGKHLKCNVGRLLKALKLYESIENDYFDAELKYSGQSDKDLVEDKKKIEENDDIKEEEYNMSDYSNRSEDNSNKHNNARKMKEVLKDNEEKKENIEPQPIPSSSRSVTCSSKSVICSPGNDNEKLPEPKSKSSVSKQKLPENVGEKNDEWVPIGSGMTHVHKDQYRKINFKSYTAATRGLLVAVFSRKTLATHSLTGKRSPAFQNKPAKMCLDPKKVSDIVYEVSTKCNVRENFVRTVITTKCADECKMYKMRMTKKEKQRQSTPSTIDTLQCEDDIEMTQESQANQTCPI